MRTKIKFITSATIILLAMLMVSACDFPSKKIDSKKSELGESPVANESRARDSKEVYGKSEIFFDPADMSVAGGQRFSLDVKMNPQQEQVSAVELHVKFDPAKVRAVDAEISAEILNTLQKPQIDNNKGEISIIAGVPVRDTISFISQTSKIAKINFQSVSGAKGTSVVDFTKETQAAAKDKKGNVISKTTGSKISIK